MLLCLIGNAKTLDECLTSKFFSKSQIFDMGATHHITGDESWLVFEEDIFEYPVFPNGESVLATEADFVNLPDHVTLKHV